MRTRRHTRSGPSLLALAPGRRFLRDLGLVLLTFAVGYAVSVFWLSPAPAFGTSDRAVPRLLELAEAQAREKVRASGFRARLDGERPHDSLPRGMVVWQDPPPGVVLPTGSPVDLVLSAGRAQVPVPDVVGLAAPGATRVLLAAGVSLGAVDSVAGGAEPGVVLATRPGAGVGRPQGAPVDLIVGRGPGGPEQ